MVEAKLRIDQEIMIPIGENQLAGFLSIPENAKGLVLFAHGSGSSRHSKRNQFVAKYMQEEGLGTLLFDLLSEEEEKIDEMNRELRFNIPLLSERLIKTTEWVLSYEPTHGLGIGLFGASTGAAAALIAAAELSKDVKAVVSRGGRPDLAGSKLMHVKAPTLLIVGGADYGVIELNDKAFGLLTCEKKFEIVPHATHLFQEPGTLEEVGHKASIWFNQFL